jgi:PAS domain S-box-containing protein
MVAIAGMLTAMLASGMGIMALSRFNAVEAAWETYNHRSVAITTTMLELRRQIGYGGFIHNFKNYVLRRDTARYYDAIERNIAGLNTQLDLLDQLFQVPEDQAQVAIIRATFTEYAEKFRQVDSLVRQGADSNGIDAVVKVDDGPALLAFAHLQARTEERAQEAEKLARDAHASAITFFLAGGGLVVVGILVAVLTMIVYLRRIVAANEATRRARQQLDIMLDTAPDPMITVDRAGGIRRVNRMAERFFGYTSEDMRAMSVDRLIPAAQRNAHTGHVAHYFANPSHRPMGAGLALAALTADGRMPSVEVSLSHTDDNGEPLAMVTIRDVTEQVRIRDDLIAARRHAEEALAQQQLLQNELVQVEKLAALGGLVAGIAHEINTPVGVTLSAATHLESETRKTDRSYQAGELTEAGLTEYFETARQAVQLMTLNSQRAADLIQGFKQVAVDQTGGERRSFDLGAYVDEILLSLGPRLKKTSVAMATHCPPGIEIHGYPGALSQILTNLVFNSLTHAFDPGQDGHILITATAEDGQVTLVYGDDGKGIPPNLQTKVFEPFFTTRRGSGGSGLGLHILHTLVTQTLRGSVRLDSSPGQGATFTLRFPQRHDISQDNNR